MEVKRSAVYITIVVAAMGAQRCCSAKAVDISIVIATVGAGR
jgi:hypothetical protein